ncbi:sulfonate ABC transporter substrate-binding protein [Burkholderia sp. Ac-20344]|uniref:sulfonate ABC transporter substrate-binding protein n=1 Tax=Burkholderia sp. Ac-20344 TaxID=2703890 RepID=UPI00197B18FE|nr:sulfonate ABC transporter substrate-binding protein [Burkholderia sp. Ac-20344]MBN3835034.1 sulfonate ABC transporter substrate-binding protein [Burkholderia sp. Ac-20344]
MTFSRRSFLRTAQAAAVAAFAAPFARGVRADTGRTLRIGYQKGTPLTLLKAQRSLDKPLAARGFDIAWTEFPAGPPLLEAMNAGSIDLGYTGSPPPIFAQAAGSRIVYLAAEAGGPHNEAIIVLDGSPLKSVADLKGRTVAFARGSSSNYLIVAALEKAGLTYADIKPAFLSPADARAAFEGGKVDAWVIWDPYLAVVQQTLGVRTIADYASGIVQPYSFFLGAPDFAKSHPEVLSDVLSEVARADAWIASHRSDAARLIAREIGVPQPVVERYLARSSFGLLPVNSTVLGAQQRVADTFRRANIIPRAIQVADIAHPVSFTR